jgi:hypothetical protein
MVNGRFPPTSIYGFEMVDAPKLALAHARAVNRKFTPNPIIAIFHKVSPI